MPGSDQSLAAPVNSGLRPGLLAPNAARSLTLKTFPDRPGWLAPAALDNSVALASRSAADRASDVAVASAFGLFFCQVGNALVAWARSAPACPTNLSSESLVIGPSILPLSPPALIAFSSAGLLHTRAYALRDLSGHTPCG